MKRISTKIFRLSFLSILLTAAFSASAEEYKSMIRYDRVWEHISFHWDDRQVYHVKFDGPEEINGKTYHRLVTFRKASFAYDSDGQPYLFDVDENYYRHEGYLREEDGKVYTLLCNVQREDKYSWWSLYVPSSDDRYPSDLEEKVLYDFTCKEGESYQGLFSEGGASEMTYHVESVENVDIDGENHRLLWVYPDGYGRYRNCR